MIYKYMVENQQFFEKSHFETSSISRYLKALGTPRHQWGNLERHCTRRASDENPAVYETGMAEPDMSGSLQAGLLRVLNGVTHL